MANSKLADIRQRLRAEMPVAERWAYFDHAAVAPITRPAASRMQRWLEQIVSEGDTDWPEWAREVEKTRRTAAAMIGADVDEIALVPNTTAGLNLVAEGLDWEAGDNVVTLDDEFPSNLYPWMHLTGRGVETRLAPTQAGRVNLDVLRERCDRRTRVISVSWVGYANGCRRDLKAISEIAAEWGALFVVDAIQGLGAFPLDVGESRIDVLAADGHKWMLGPEGAGIAYVRRECLSRLRAVGVGWHSVVQESDFTRIDLRLKPTAERYEGGTQNMAGMIGLGASLELLTSIGLENIAAAVLDITDRVCVALAALGARVISPRQGEERSGIVSFKLSGVDLTEVRRHCLSRGVALACRGGRLRISPHAYNDETDIERLVEAIQSFRG